MNLEKMAKKIEKKNEEFTHLSPKEKMVMIAKDVLEQLETKRLKALSNHYLGIPQASRKKVGKGIASNTQLRDLYAKMPTCYACAIGACFVSGIKIFDSFTYADSGYVLDPHNIVMRDYLRRFLTLQELADIETIFEKDSGPALVYQNHNNEAPSPSKEAIEVMQLLDGEVVTGETLNGYHFPRHCQFKPIKRLQLIMHTIIDCQGKFDSKYLLQEMFKVCVPGDARH